jgi:predicted alpha/beta-fold hydrolase
LRQKGLLEYRRERISLPDGDFLDIDHTQDPEDSQNWLNNDKPHVLILHGLEGNSHSGYVIGMAYQLQQAGYAVTAINYRGCSGATNRLPRFYHSGATEDVAAVVAHLLRSGGPAKTVAVIGFSLGGNQCLKFMGELSSRWVDLSTKVVGGLAFSVPIDLGACSAQISLPENRLYENRFIKALSNKIRTKHRIMPDALGLNPEHLSKIKILKDFDDLYTAPLHGYPDANTYYAANSSLGFLPTITHPTMIVQADNDPFLSPEIRSPSVIVSPSTQLQITRGGGHCGWLTSRPDEGSYYWSNVLALRWLRQF